MPEIMKLVESREARTDIPNFEPGDTVKVHVKVKEGDKERIQIFQGLVISRKGGGTRQMFTVRKVSGGVGVERMVTLYSPSIDRMSVCRHIISRARAVAIGVMEPQTIDTINILRASKLAMAEAVDQMRVRPDVLLLDAVTIESLEMPQIPLIEGDKRSVSIAAASVVAKVSRDLLMESYHDRYPVYDFRHNRGYATEGHQPALNVHGPSPLHRNSFEGLEESTLLVGRD